MDTLPSSPTDPHRTNKYPPLRQYLCLVRTTNTLHLPVDRLELAVWHRSQAKGKGFFPWRQWVLTKARGHSSPKKIMCFKKIRIWESKRLSLSSILEVLMMQEAWIEGWNLLALIIKFFQFSERWNKALVHIPQTPNQIQGTCASDFFYKKNFSAPKVCSLVLRCMAPWLKVPQFTPMTPHHALRYPFMLHGTFMCCIAKTNGSSTWSLWRLPPS